MILVRDESEDTVADLLMIALGISIGHYLIMRALHYQCRSSVIGRRLIDGQSQCCLDIVLAQFECTRLGRVGGVLYNPP